MKRLFLFSLIFLNLCASNAIAYWDHMVQGTVDGDRCILFNLSGYKDPSLPNRDRPELRLIVQSFDPVMFKLEIWSGIDSSLPILGGMKIGSEMFVLKFNDEIGTLQNGSPKALSEALMSGEYVAIGYRHQDKMIYDKFDLKGLREELDKLRKICTAHA